MNPGNHDAEHSATLPLVIRKPSHLLKWFLCISIDVSLLSLEVVIRAGVIQPSSLRKKCCQKTLTHALQHRFPSHTDEPWIKEYASDCTSSYPSHTNCNTCSMSAFPSAIFPLLRERVWNLSIHAPSSISHSSSPRPSELHGVVLHHGAEVRRSAEVRGSD